MSTELTKYALLVASWTYYELGRSTQEHPVSTDEASRRALRIYGTFEQWIQIYRAQQEGTCV